MIRGYGGKGGGAQDSTDDLRNPIHIGQQVRLKEQGSGGTWAPGNFGLLSLPDGSSGASDLEAALASLSPEDCCSLDVTTATGSNTNKIVNAVNSRWPSGYVDRATTPSRGRKGSDQARRRRSPRRAYQVETVAPAASVSSRMTISGTGAPQAVKYKASTSPPLARAAISRMRSILKSPQRTYSMAGRLAAIR
jgi:hypothetical protein